MGKVRSRYPTSANLFRMFFVKLPQNRHPACPGLPRERSASQIDRVTQRLCAECGVEGRIEGLAGGKEIAQRIAHRLEDKRRSEVLGSGEILSRELTDTCSDSFFIPPSLLQPP